jgi:hypothetical protein
MAYAGWSQSGIAPFAVVRSTSRMKLSFSLRSGKPLSADDLEKLRSATSATGPAGDPNAVIVPGKVQRFRWEWKSNDSAPDNASEPATYYEAFTGKPDPMRAFFVASRRVLDVVTWFIALGVPLGLVTLGIVTGASPETIFFMGFAGLVVGMMFKYSLPKTPFG